MWFLLILHLNGQQVAFDEPNEAACNAAKAAWAQETDVKTAVCWQRVATMAEPHPMPPRLSDQQP